MDYLVKPFSTGELSVRLEGHLRQTRRPPETVLRAGDLQFDQQRRRVFLEGSEVPLTAKKFILLESEPPPTSRGRLGGEATHSPNAPSMST